MSNLTSTKRLNLQKMVAEYGSTDNTDNIQKLKHSILIRNDIRKLDTYIKTNTKYDRKDQRFIELCSSQVPFLYHNYIDIFHRIMNDELDFEIMTKLLIVLTLIEDGKVDQNEGSVMVGKVLKELYVDSALKKSKHLDEKYEEPTKIDLKETNQISWKEYKQMKK